MIDLRLAEAMMATRVEPDYRHHYLVHISKSLNFQSQAWLSSQKRRLLHLAGHKLMAWGERLEQYGLPPSYA
jgi:hypothetical protein